MIDRQTRARIKAATIPEWVALDLLRDIDSAIRNRDAGSLRNFAAEAAASGLDQESQRAFEIADVIEHKAATSAREELLRIKAALRPAPPSQSDLVREYDRQAMASMFAGPPFNRNTYEQDEARRVQVQNEMLSQRDRVHEEQRAQGAPHEPAERPWWRR